MAALSEYPSRGSALVRGDPVEIPVNVSTNGVPEDASAFDWRSQIRTTIDGPLVVEFTITVVTPAGGTVPSQLLLTLTPDESQLLATGMVFDVEQLDKATGETIRTWWIVTRLNMQRDVSYDEP